MTKLNLNRTAFSSVLEFWEGGRTFAEKQFQANVRAALVNKEYTDEVVEANHKLTDFEKLQSKASSLLAGNMASIEKYRLRRGKEIRRDEIAQILLKTIVDTFKMYCRIPPQFDVCANFMMAAPYKPGDELSGDTKFCKMCEEFNFSYLLYPAVHDHETTTTNKVLLPIMDKHDEVPNLPGAPASFSDEQPKYLWGSHIQEHIPGFFGEDIRDNICSYYATQGYDLHVAIPVVALYQEQDTRCIGVINIHANVGDAQHLDDERINRILTNFQPHVYLVGILMRDKSGNGRYGND